MSTTCAFLLALTLILSGAYAGLVLMCEIAILPAMQRLSLPAYADAWRAMDASLDRSMPPYKACLLLVNGAALALLVVQRRVPLATFTGASLLCSLGGLLLTVRKQLPLNAQLKALPADAPTAVLLDIREKTIRGFKARMVLAAGSFLALCFGIVFWPVR